jgi:hypothetical protein
MLPIKSHPLDVQTMWELRLADAIAVESGFVMYIPAMVDQPGPNWALGFDHRRAAKEGPFFRNMTTASAKMPHGPDIWMPSGSALV